jgi:hypothetical protein
LVHELLAGSQSFPTLPHLPNPLQILCLLLIFRLGTWTLGEGLKEDSRLSKLILILG